MNDPTYQAPLPSPDGQIANQEPFNAAEILGRPWKEAPSIIRGGAYAAALLYGLFSAVFLLIGLIPSPDKEQNALFLLAGSIGIAVTIWLRRALKWHSQAAWKAQIVLSCIGLFAFPLGTIISIFILLEWFKPETKAWFGKT